MKLKDFRPGDRGTFKSGEDFQVLAQLGQLTMVDCPRGRWSLDAETEVQGKRNNTKEKAMTEKEKVQRSGERARIIKEGIDAGKSPEDIVKAVQKVFPDLKSTKIRMQISAIKHYRKNRKTNGKAKAEKAPKAKAEKAPKAEPKAKAKPEKAPKAKAEPKAEKPKKEKPNKKEKPAPAPAAPAQPAAPAAAAPAPAAPAAADGDDLF